MRDESGDNRAGGNSAAHADRRAGVAGRDAPAPEAPQGQDGRAEDVSTSVTIILNPRWLREWTGLLRLGHRVRNTAVAVLGYCTTLAQVVGEDEPTTVATWGRRLASYKQLVARTEAAILAHPAWHEMPTAGETYGEIMSLLRAAMSAASALGSGEGNDLDAMTRPAKEAAGRAFGLEKLLLESILDPMKEDGQRMVRAWRSGLRLSVTLTEDGDPA